jgi:hypothetical protein
VNLICDSVVLQWLRKHPVGPEAIMTKCRTMYGAVVHLITHDLRGVELASLILDKWYHFNWERLGITAVTDGRAILLDLRP